MEEATSPKEYQLPMAIVHRPQWGRFAIAIAIALVTVTTGVSWKLFHATDIDLGLLTGSPRRPLVVVGGKVQQMPSGDYLAANTLVDTSGCSSTNVIAWNGSAFACASAGGGGGITNSAGNNIIMKSNGTNAVASTITDNGTIVSTPSQFQIGGTAPSSSQLMLVTDNTATDTVATWVQTGSTNHVGSLGNNEEIGVVYRINDTFDTSTNNGHASALDIVVDGSISAGAGTLENIGIAIAGHHTQAGVSNYAIKSTDTVSTLEHDGPAQFGGPSGTSVVQLGNTVKRFTVLDASPTTITPQLDVGVVAGVDGYNVHLKNTATGVSAMGMVLEGDTTVTAAIAPQIILGRGAGGSYAQFGMLCMDNGSSACMGGAAANDMVLADYATGSSMWIASKGTIHFGTVTQDDVDITVKGHIVQNTGTGAPGLGAGCTSGGSSAIAGNDNAFRITTGATSTACTITFVNTWTQVPICIVQSEAGATFTTGTNTATTVVLSANQSAKIYDVMCFGPPGST